MDQFKKLLASLPTRQLLTVVICAFAVGAGVIGFSRWQRENGMRPLYTSLSPEDANAMVQKLREGGVDFKLSENGTSVLVAEDKVPELRLEMAGLGLPKTGRIGFEIFDKTNFGITEFAEHVNYRRAVEGELERSIMAIAEVQQARVHVSLPKESVFTDSREPAKASVLVGLRPATRLSQQNVFAITNLVASAVEGLSPEAVAVVDMRGNLLSRPRKDGAADSVQSTEAALDYRQAVERDLTAKINNTLEPLLGADKFRTGVSAEVDMTSGEQSEEMFDPTKTVMVSSQKTEDSSSNTRAAATTAPGVAANMPQPSATPASQQPPTTTPQQASNDKQQPTQQPPAQQQAAQQAAQRPAGNSTSTMKRMENITYQSSRTTKHIKLAQGGVKRLSIAVLVDQGSKWEGTGNQVHRVVTPPDPEKLKAIQSLVGTLVGLDTQRGDQLTVEALPFDNTLSADVNSPGSAPVAKKVDQVLSLETLKQKPALLWGSVGGAVVVLALVVFAVSRMGKGHAAIEARAALPIPVVSDTASISAVAAAPSVAGGGFPALMPSRTETLISQLQDSGRNNPEAWAGVLRGWLAEEETN